MISGGTEVYYFAEFFLILEAKCEGDPLFDPLRH